MVPVVVVDRPGWRLKALASKPARAFAASRVPETEAGTLATRPAPAWTFLTGPLSHVSSTAIRNRAKAKQQTVAKKAQPPASLPWKKANTAPEQEISAPQPGPERLTVADA
jgi:nicotinic acid mononucleotide adenylyltransferase